MAKAPENLHVVIIAGGVGSRLWPKSRKDLPKQFFHLWGGKSLANLTYNRLKDFIPDDRIYIVAPKYYKDLIKKELPNIPEKNYILEPQKQGTTAANLLSAAIIYNRDPNATVHLLVADDYLNDNKRFQKMSTLSTAETEDGSVVVFGVKPRHAHTGFGYIKVGGRLSKDGDIETFRALKFVEKPDEKTARKYLESKKYYWHGSGFAAKAETILQSLKQYRGLKAVTGEIQDYISEGKSLSASHFIHLYKKILKEPIEKTFLENASSVKMVTLEDTWNDVGSWSQVYEILPKDQNNNVILGDKDKVVMRNCGNNIIFTNGKLITLTDLHSMVVIDTEDSLLICPMANAENVKKIVEILKEKKLTQYL